MAEQQTTVLLARHGRAGLPLTSRLDDLVQSVAELQQEVRGHSAPRPSIDVNDILKAALLAALKCASPDAAAAIAEGFSGAPVEPEVPVREGGELHDLRERVAKIARALGACPCFGDEAGCHVCHGAGKPGWREVDQSLFDHYRIGQVTEQSSPDGATDPRPE